MYVGLRLRMNEISIATALQFYHTFQLNMDTTLFSNHVREDHQYKQKKKQLLTPIAGSHGNTLPCRQSPGFFSQAERPCQHMLQVSSSSL